MSKSTYFQENKQLVIKQTPLRELPAGWIRVEPKAVAINPTDYKHLATQVADGTSSGVDFSGVVSAVGSGVTDVKVGDTVCGCAAAAYYEMPADGAFSTSIDLLPGAWIKTPNLVVDKSNHIESGPIRSFEQASSLGIGVLTAAIAFEHYNKVPLVKNSQKGFALIYGASGSLGFQAVQIAKYVGYTVIAVASSKHAELLKQVGADHVIDYHNKDWVSEARKIGGDDIQYAYDTISQNDTFHQVYMAVSHNKPAKINLSLWGLDLPAQPRENVSFDSPLLYLLWVNEKDWLTTHFDGIPELRAKRAEITKRIGEIIAEGGIQNIPIDVVAEGFENIPKLFDAFVKGTSGNKLVLRY